MHIAEGVLSPAVAASGWLASAAGIYWGLRCMEPEAIPRTAMMTAAFFTASLIQVPIGPGHTHLVLSGLAGILLGPATFPSLAVALFLQALLFQFGGLSSLGVNLLIMAVPAVVFGFLFQGGMRRRSGGRGRLWGFAFMAGMGSVWLSALMQAGALLASDPTFRVAGMTLAAIHAVSGPVEGLITAFTVTFLEELRPGLAKRGGIR